MQRKPTKAFWRAYGALYGKQQELEPLPKPKKPKKAKPDCPTEKHEHFAAHYKLQKMGVRHNHSPNGGYRDIREAAAFKRMGTSAGFPDFEIPYARKGYHGLYIELKRVYGGVLSEQQKEWRDHLKAEGYCWYMARGCDDLIQFVQNYLSVIS